jgi:2-dehydro-3-deoxyphosphogluconate aldolase/(4S)-4-hydroxy-2-oxoglutarate aldolase
MDKNSALQKLKDTGVVAVIRKPSKQQIEHIAKALVDGGVCALEITIETEGALEMIQSLKQQYKDQVLVGAGTVLDPDAAEKAIKVGADFIFSPNFDPDTIRVTNEAGKLSIPGVMTPTEIVQAYRAGADLLKIFPGSSLGVNYIKELQGPLGHIPMMPTGGVNLENVAQLIKNGAVAVGIGGSLLDKRAIEAGQYQLIAEIASQYIEKIRQARQEG